MSNIDTLIEDNKNLIWAVIGQKFKFCPDNEEAYSHGLIGLWKAAKKFNPTRGSFKSFAYTCIFYEINREFINKENRYRQKYRQAQYHQGVYQDSFNHVDLQDDLRTLPLIERCILTRIYLNSESQTSIANDFGKHRQEISVIHSRGLARLKERYTLLNRDSSRAQHRDRYAQIE